MFFPFNMFFKITSISSLQVYKLKFVEVDCVKVEIKVERVKPKSNLRSTT